MSDERSEPTASPTVDVLDSLVPGMSHGQRTKTVMPLAEDLGQWGATKAILQEIEGRVAHLGTDYRERLSFEVARCCVVAKVLEESSANWLLFCRDSFWHQYRHRPSLWSRSEALRFVLLRVMGGGGRSASQRVSMFCRALASLDEEGVKPEDIPLWVKKRGGWEKIASDSAKRRKAKPKKAALKPPAGVGAKPDLTFVGRFGSCYKQVARMKMPCQVNLLARIERTPAGEITAVIEAAVFIERAE